jgi:hypothetical protein
MSEFPSRHLASSHLESEIVEDYLQRRSDGSSAPPEVADQDFPVPALPEPGYPDIVDHDMIPPPEPELNSASVEQRDRLLRRGQERRVNREPTDEKPEGDGGTGFDGPGSTFDG